MSSFFLLGFLWGFVADGGYLDSPEWKRTEAQIWGPGQTYKWESSWTFGLV